MKLSLTEFFLHEGGELPSGNEPLVRPKSSKKFKNLPKGDEPLAPPKNEATGFDDFVAKIVDSPGASKIPSDELQASAYKAWKNGENPKSFIAKFLGPSHSFGDPLPGPDPENLDDPSGDMDNYGFTGGDEDYDDEFGDPHQGVEPTKGMNNPKDISYTQSTAFNDEEPRKPYAEHADPTNVVDAGSTIWSDPTQPAKVKKFKNKNGNLHLDLREMFSIEEMGGPGSGRPKGSKNKPKPGAVVPGKPVDPSSLPDDFDDFDVDVDTSEWDPEPAGSSDEPKVISLPEPEPDKKGKGPSGFGDDTFSRGADDFGDDLSWLDDPNLGKGTEVPKQDPSAPKPKKAPPMAASDYEGPWQGSPEFNDAVKDYDFSPGPAKPGRTAFWKEVEDNDLETMSWEELEEMEPEIAADIGAEFPDLADPGNYGDTRIPRERGVIFAFDKSGELVMLSGGGDRFKWDADSADWTPMDEGE